MLFSIFYELSLWCLCLIAFPRMFYQRIWRGKYRESFFKRLGIGFPSIKKNGRQLIWIHAVSVGETQAIAPLVKMLKMKFKNPIIVISNVTETGHAEAERSIPQADYRVYLPFDLRFIVNSIVKSVKPDLVILSESDFWYNFLKACKDVGASTVLVNGKISANTMNRFLKFKTFAKHLFPLLDLMCVQSEQYFKRFEEIGVPKEKMIVTGNLKFDGEYLKLPQDQLNAWKTRLGIGPDDHVLVIGSTHDPEEKMLLKVLNQVWSQFPNLKVVIVPRHPERFNEVAGILNTLNIPFTRFSQLSAHHPNDSRVILIDAMGLLRKCYQFADVAIVAGSFTPKVGGHNILEPTWYGVPVLFGPHMHAQTELSELVKQWGAGYQTPLDDLKATLQKMLADKEERQRVGQAGLKMVEGINGATKKTLDALYPLAKAKKSCCV